MKDVHYLKNGKIYYSFAVLAIFMVLIFPKRGAFPYEYQKGSPWTYETLIAPIDFPILKTESEMLEEKEKRASDVVEYYVFDESVASNQIRRFNSELMAHGFDTAVAESVNSFLEARYASGILADYNREKSYDKVIFVKKGKRVEETPISEIYDLEDSYSALTLYIEDDFGIEFSQSLDSAINLKGFLVPNLSFDEATSQLYHKEAVNYISPTKGIIYSGQLIVSEGELITAEIEQLLDSYKTEYKISLGSNVSAAAQLYSHIIFIITIIIILFAIIFLIDPAILGDMRKLIFILNLFALSFLITVIAINIDEKLLFLVPFAVFVLYMSAFFKDATVFPIYVILLIPLLIIAENGPALFLSNLVAGSIALVSFSVLNRGWRQFINIIFIFIGLLLTWSAFYFEANSATSLFKSVTIAYLFVNSVLTVVMYPFVFLFEKIYSFVSYTRLWDLSDTNNKILATLSRKAPGTFQHSIQVSNLAAAAATEIGGNSMLVRVGALYHDIGKSENPLCFIENQPDGVNYHVNLTSEESAYEITRHVDTGVMMARKAGIPEVIVDFIRAHHGRSKTLYFYNKYCNEGGDPKNVAPFTYDGILPQTKEHVILMMADAVEAASRTLRSYDEASIKALVDSITDTKMKEGQMLEADISLREIDAVKKSLVKNLVQIYHGRIAYPKRKQ